MSLNWNLNRIFESFESDSFIQAVEHCKKLAKTSNTTIDVILLLDSEVDIMTNYMKHVTMIKESFSPVYSFSSLSFATDSSNQRALQTLQQLQELKASMVVGHVRFEKWLSQVESLSELIESDDFLKTHHFYLQQIVDQSKYALDESLEAVIAKMRTTGSQAWNTLQQKSASNIVADVELDGEVKELPLQAIRNLAYEKDASKRKLGYEAEMKAYKLHEEVSASALNGIKGESLTLSNLRGYKSPLEQTLKKSKMNQATLDAMLEAMRDSMPKFRTYLKRKAELLGHENGLPFYDLMAPLGDSDITFPYEQGKELVLEQFKTFSKELYDFAKKAFDKDWIDVEPKKGKAGGAFCASVLSIKESRILLNYTGKLNNAITLAHELGHAFHNKKLFNEAPLNIGSPMPLAETASIFCETIVKNAAIKQADDASAFGILEVALQGYSQVIIDIYSRFLFETSLFDARKEGTLSPDQLKELMLAAQEATYGDGLDSKVKHPYMWMNKPHYYIPDMDFYNFPYAFGLLFAKGLFAKYQEDGEDFVPKLNTLLSSTGKMDVVDVAKQLDIDVTDKAFWKASLDVITLEIDHFIELSHKI